MNRLAKQPLPAKGDLLAYAGLLVTTQTGMHLFAGTGAESNSSDIFYALAGSVYAAVGLFFALRPSRLLRHAKQTWPIMLLVLLAALSTTWSNNPALTLRRVVALVGTTLLAFYVVDRYDFRQFLRLLILTLATSAIISVFLIAVYPEIGIHDDKHMGAWRGGFPHKNEFGALMALGVLASFYCIRQTRLATSGLLVTGFFMMLGMVIMSSSRTAWIITLVGLFMFPLMKLLKLHMSLAVPAAIVVALIATLALVHFSADVTSVAELVGRDATFTGRTTLWQTAVQLGSDKTWFGHGYGAFWTGDAGVSGHLRHVVNWEVDSAHNAYIDLWLHLGLVGLICFSLAILLLGVAFLRQIRSGNENAFWHGTFLVYLLTLGAAGGNFMDQNSLTWVLFVTTGASSAGWSTQRRYKPGTMQAQSQPLLANYARSMAP